MTKLQQHCIEVFEISKIDSFVPYVGKRTCRLTTSHIGLARAFNEFSKINQRNTNLYDLMDAAYDSPIIKEHRKSLGHIPIIDKRPKREQKSEHQIELKTKRRAHYKTAQMIRDKGHAKVMSHLMLGIIALTVN